MNAITNCDSQFRNIQRFMTDLWQQFAVTGEHRFENLDCSVNISIIRNELVYSIISIRVYPDRKRLF